MPWNRLSNEIHVGMWVKGCRRCRASLIPGYRCGVSSRAARRVSSPVSTLIYGRTSLRDIFRPDHDEFHS
jgi:hypothetical protein